MTKRNLPSHPLFFPVFLGLSDKGCLVVGGGKVAFQKASALRRAGGRVRVVAPRREGPWGRLSGVRFLRRRFRSSDVPAGTTRPWLVVAATDDEKLNRRVAGLCHRRRIWVNTVDRPSLCDFIFPAVVRQGPLTAAFSTGGRSPALAGYLGRRLRKLLGSERAAWVALLSKKRPVLLRVPMPRRKKFLGRVFRRWEKLGRRRKSLPAMTKVFTEELASLQPRRSTKKS